MSHWLAEVDESWTLFLDRDGVINEKLDNDYVKHISEFEFKPRVLEAMYFLSKYFYKMVVVTNQQGIAKGLMSHEELKKVHDYMMYKMEQANVHIDNIYYCPHYKTECNYCRKPNAGMAYEAQKEDANIDFGKSIIIGDSESDMLFGKNAGMKRVGIGDGLMNVADLVVKDVYGFYLLMEKYKSHLA